MKKVLIALVGMVVVFVVALFAVPPMLSWDFLKTRVATAVKEQTGRDLEIDRIGLSILPSISVDLEGVRLSNAGGMEPPEMLTLGSLQLEMGLFPLLTKSVRIDRLLVSDLTLFLERNEDGADNWTFPSDETKKHEGGRSDHGGGMPLSDLVLGDLRLENIAVTFTDHLNGQSVQLSDLKLAATLPAFDSPFDLVGEFLLNGERVELSMAVASPQALAEGDDAKIEALIDSALLKLESDLALSQKPQTAVDGGVSLNVGSVGALLAWIDRPLPEGQPDPGPLDISATFVTEGEKVVLREAVIAGDSLDAKATGSLDTAGEVTKIVLDVQSGPLDIDRYLPPPKKETDAPDSEPAFEGRPYDHGEGISDEPFDLSGLRGTEADIRVALGGIKAMGYEIGPVDFVAALAGGVLESRLERLDLYGGGVTGALQLDGSGEDVGLNANFTVDKVDLGDLAAVGAEGPPPVDGVASGQLTAEATGRSPRALVESVKGGLQFKLGEVNVQNAAAAALTGVDLNVDLPGISQSPSVAGTIVYNKQKVGLDVGLDPLDKVLSGDPFAARLNVQSEHVSLSFDGTIQQPPTPAVDGSFGFESPSIGRLLAWLGQPLPSNQPDPGPLKVSGAMETDGGKVSLKSLDLTGKAVEATASGFFDPESDVPQFGADIRVASLDLNAYLPPQSKEKKPAADAPADTGEKGWSTEPIDFSPLRLVEGEVSLTTGTVLYREVRVTESAAKVTLEGGVLSAVLSKLQFDQGSASASATVDGSGETPKISYEAELSGVESKPFLVSFAGMDRLSGLLAFAAKGETAGSHQKALVSALNGEGYFKFEDGAYEGFDLAGTLRNAGTLGIASGGERPKTDFTELGGSFTIVDGLLNNPDFKMLAPLVRVTGAGDVPLPPRTIDYRAEAKLVGSIEGQGGNEALAGLPIPIHIKGSWDKPKIKVDWESVFQAALLDPERMAIMPDDMKSTAQGLGLAIPGFGGGSEGEGAGGVEGAIGGALNQLLGGSSGSSGDNAESSAEEPAASDSGETKKEKKKKKKKKESEAEKLLKKLF